MTIKELQEMEQELAGLKAKVDEAKNIQDNIKQTEKQIETLEMINSVSELCISPYNNMTYEFTGFVDSCWQQIRNILIEQKTKELEELKEKFTLL